MNTITATNLANSGYNYMVGAIQDYFNQVIPVIVQSREGTTSSDAWNTWKDKTDKLAPLLQKKSDFEGQIKAIQDQIAKETDPVVIANLQKQIDNPKDGLQKQLNDVIAQINGIGDPGPEPVINKENKISSNEFNTLQSTLTTFLN